VFRGLCLQRYLVVMWLVPCETAAVSAHVLCRTRYHHAPVYSVTIIETTYVGCMYILVYVTCHLHVWQNDRDLCYCGNVGVERIQKYELAQKVEPGEENVFAGNQTRDLSMTIRRSTTELYPLE